MKSSTFNSNLILRAIGDSFRKLNPKSQIKNPVMFITAIAAFLTTMSFFQTWINNHFSSFEFQVSIWLWFTVLFANFSESLAEGRGKAQAEGFQKKHEPTPVHDFLRRVQKIKRNKK